MSWNLHLVGESLEHDLEDVLADLVAKLEEIGHTLTSATLTTDAGPKSLATAPAPDEPTQSVGGEPVTPTAPVFAAPGAVAPAATPGVAPTDPNPIVAPSSPAPGAVPPGNLSGQVPTDTPPTLA
jgi:hypothetical protein